MGGEDLLAAFRDLAGRKLGTAAVEVIPVTSISELRSCRLVFFGDTRVIGPVEVSGATLTVGTVSGFSRGGGMIEMVRERNKFRFLVNPATVRASGLQVSSQLLKLATLVEEK